MIRGRILHRAALAAALVLALAVPARAACTYVPLTTDITQSTGTSPTIYQFTTTHSYWSAVGVRPSPGEDWDMYVYSATAASPTCVSGLLASSTGGGSTLDFVIGDFNHDPLGTYYASATRFTGTGAAYAQWSGDNSVVPVNGASVSSSMLPVNLLRVWDVSLTAGTTYTFDFYPQGGSGAHLVLFGNTAGGTYWTGRSGAKFDVTGSTTFTPTTSGFYGLVVTNDLGAGFNYSLGVTASACPIPATLANQVPVTVSAPGGSLVAFDVEAPYWMGCAVRGNAADWDIGMYSEPSGQTAPNCLGNPLAFSTLSGTTVDLAIGDFNTSPKGWYFADAYASVGTTAGVEFTGSQGVLSVNDDPSAVAFGASDLAKVFDVSLTGGRTYTVNFSPGASGMTLLVFGNVVGGAYYTNRSSALLSTTTTTSFTAPVSGWYALAVVNDAAASGTNYVGIGDCSLVTSLSPSVTVSSGYLANAHYAFEMNTAYWTAVGLRSTTSDWDLVVAADSSSGNWPACATTLLASSAFSPPKQDFVIGDFNYNPFGRYYVHAHRFTGAFSDTAAVEWTGTNLILLPNDNNAVTYPTGPSDVLRTFDVYLLAGQSYEFDLAHAGSAGLKMLLFGNPTAGVYWAGRSSALFEATATQTFTAPTTGFYGLVVVNDDGGADSYTVRIKTCNAPLAFPSWPTAYWNSYDPRQMVQFTPTTSYWTPIATRAQSAGSDYDLSVFSSATGGVIGDCMSGLLASSSYFAGTTDYVVGNFNFNTLGTYYARADRFYGFDGTEVAWYDGGHQLVANAALTTVAANPYFLVQSWDASLTAGQQYTVFFAHDPGLNAKVDVFSATPGVFWGGRSLAMVEGQHTVQFTAPVNGWYGVVVVSDGGSGTFDIGLRTGFVGVDDSPTRPANDALRGVSPNPGRSGLHLDFALRNGGEPVFEVVDMAGRVVAHVQPGARGAGQWTAAWAARDDGGRSLPSGLYFVRMRLDGRVVGTRKLTLLP